MPSPSARRSNIASDVAWRMPRSKSLTCGCGIPRSTPMSVWLAPVHRRKIVITAPMSRAARAERMSSRSQSPGGATG